MNISSIIIDDAYKLNYDFNQDRHLKPLTSLVCARNSSISFQVILQADQRYCINVGKTAWFSQKGSLLNLRQEIISSFTAKQFIEGMVEDDDGMRKADILLSQTVIEESANIPVAVWVELFIPQDAQEGKHNVKVNLYTNSMYEDEKLVCTATVTLDVKPYCMPSPKDYTFYLDLWQHNSNIARKHEVELWSERHFEIMERYIASLANLGQKSITVVASEIPWRGQSCFLNHRVPSNLFEYSIICVTKNADNTFSYDFSIMQRYIDLCNNYGINGDIELFGLVNVWTQASFDTVNICAEYPENMLIRYYDTASGNYRYMRDVKEIENYIHAVEGYFIKTDQIEKVRVSADEPTDIEKYRKSVDILHGLAPSFVFKTAINHAEFIEEFKDVIDDFAPYIQCASIEYEKLKKYQQEFPDKKFLWYACCGPEYPNTFIRSNLLESRLIGILTALMGFDGFLRWNYTVWPENPRQDIRYANFPAGDTNFVYPSNGGDVLLSLRYKQFKKGIEDFELLEILRKSGKQDVVDIIFQNVLRLADFSSYYKPEVLKLEQISSLSYDDYSSARTLMLDALCEI